MATVQVMKSHQKTAVTVQEGVTLLQAIQTAGISVSFPCGGRGRCGKCKVKAHGAFSPMDAVEQERLSPEEVRQGIRLACFAHVAGDCTVQLIERASEAVIENAYFDWDGTPDPIYPDGYGAAFDIGWDNGVTITVGGSYDDEPIVMGNMPPAVTETTLTVQVNGQACTQRGKKLRPGDRVVLGEVELELV